MCNRVGGPCLAGLAALLFLVLVGLVPGCSRRISEADQAAARSTAERAIRAATYDEFLTAFTTENRSRMKEAPVWIRWWQEKFEKQRGAWRVVKVEARADGTVQVTADHRRRATSHQFYVLSREGQTWRIRDIESQW